MLQRNSKLTLNMHIEGRTLLMKAAFEGDLQMVINLLREGSNVNARDKDGDTALMFAAHRGHYLIVKTLLAHGADVFALANNGWTAKRAGREGQHGDVTQLLDCAEKKNAGARLTLKAVLTTSERRAGRSE